MRIRKKRHLEDRLLCVQDYIINPERDILNVKLAVLDKKYFDYQQIFGNDNLVELEVGCGKGGFIIEKAKNNPNVNFIAVELLQNIIVMAAEKAKEEGLTNLKFVNSGAEYLPRYIKEQSISTIYLNFSPPFPQLGYESRRLTSDWFTSSYKSFLVKGGSVYQKTDDRDFFLYSKEKFIEYGFRVVDLTEKLNNNQIENVQTEYEKKFRALGMIVYGLKAQV